MNQRHVEMDVKSSTDALTLESRLKQLWEKVQAAAERISQLKDQNEKYKTQVAYLESEVLRLRSELNQKEQEIKRLKLNHSQLSESVSGNNFLSPEEMEALKSRIKDLIAKINSHL